MPISNSCDCNFNHFYYDYLVYQLVEKFFLRLLSDFGINLIILFD